MKACHFALAFLAVVCSITASAQTKVGTVHNIAPMMFSSVRAGGMGEAGVALVDEFGAFFNPAILAVRYAGNIGGVAFFPVRAELVPGEQHQRMSHYSAALNLSKLFYSDLPSYSAIISYSRTGTDYGPIPATTYEYPDGTGEYYHFKNSSQHFNLGIALVGKWQFGLGAAITRVGQKGTLYHENESTFYLGAGLLIRAPFDSLFPPDAISSHRHLHFTPAVGLVVDNIELSDDFNIAGAGSMTEFRLGASLETAVTLPGFERWKRTASVIPVIEYDEHKEPLGDYAKYGAEVELLDLVAGRVGGANLNGTLVHRTWGAGIKSQGLVRLAEFIFDAQAAPSRKGIVKFLRDDLDIEFSFARINQLMVRGFAVDYNVDFYGVSVTY